MITKIAYKSLAYERRDSRSSSMDNTCGRTICTISFTAQCCCLVIGAIFPELCFADTDGPGNPGPTRILFANNACGPCTDTNTWAAAGPNVGNGLCGRCGNKVFTRSTGSCQGTDRGPLNCKNGTCKGTATYTFTSTPVGSLAFAGCVSLAIAKGIALELVSIPVCTAACTVSATFTLGWSCVKCIAANVTVTTAVACKFADCIENCNFVPPIAWTNPVNCCK